MTDYKPRHSDERVEALHELTEQLLADSKLDRNAIQSTGQLLLAQQGINVRASQRLDGHDRRLDDQEAAIGRHDRRLASHDVSLNKINNDVRGTREATAVVATSVAHHEERLTVLERLRQHFTLNPIGWGAVVLLTVAIWLLFRSVVSWVADPVVWRRLEDWKLVLFNLAIMLGAAALAYGVVSLVFGAWITTKNRQVESDATDEPDLTVVDEPPRQSAKAS